MCFKIYNLKLNKPAPCNIFGHLIKKNISLTLVTTSIHCYILFNSILAYNI